MARLTLATGCVALFCNFPIVLDSLEMLQISPLLSVPSTSLAHSQTFPLFRILLILQRNGLGITNTESYAVDSNFKVP